MLSITHETNLLLLELQFFLGIIVVDITGPWKTGGTLGKTPAHKPLLQTSLRG